MCFEVQYISPEVPGGISVGGSWINILIQKNIPSYKARDVFYYSHRKEYHRQLCADFQTGTFKTVPDKGELFLNDVQTGGLRLLFPKNSTKRYI